MRAALKRAELEAEDIRAKGFPNRVVTALDHISRKVDQSYEEYIDKVAENGLAARVKIHDLADKMDLLHVQRLTESDMKRFNRQLAAYHKLYKLVRKARARMEIGS